jgi:hypothetical protein
MQDVIDALRDRQKASASQALPTLEERRASFVPGDRLHPVPDDVLVTEVTAGGVPAYWLNAAGADAGRVLLFCTAEVSSSGRFAATASWPPGWDGPVENLRGYGRAEGKADTPREKEKGHD